MYYEGSSDKVDRRIPKFESREAEVQFWDETGLEDLAPDEYEELEGDRALRDDRS